MTVNHSMLVRFQLAEPKTYERKAIDMKIMPKELCKAIAFQCKKEHALRNIFITHNAFGILFKASHINTHTNTGQEKVKYNTLASAQKAAQKMSEKRQIPFRVYKCAYCTGYHVGIALTDRKTNMV